MCFHAGLEILGFGAVADAQEEAVEFITNKLKTPSSRPTPGDPATSAPHVEKTGTDTGRKEHDEADLTHCSLRDLNEIWAMYM